MIKYYVPGIKVANYVTYLLLLLFFSLPAAHATSESVWIQSIMNGDGNEPSTKETNEQRLEEADAYIQQGSLNPVVWYLRGGFGFGRRYYYQIGLLKEGKPYLLNAPKNQALIEDYQSYYRKALDLNEAVDAPEHLTVEMLGTMADDVLAAPDIKERGYKKSIALAQAGKADVESGRFEYETYQFLLESYSAQKNPDKYLETLNEMIERFGSSEELEGYKRHVETVIEQRDRKAALEASKVVAK